MHTAWRRALLLESQPTSFGLILQEEKEEEEKEKRGFIWAAITFPDSLLEDACLLPVKPEILLQV